MKKLILTFGVCGILIAAPACQKEEVKPQVETEQILLKECCGGGPGENGGKPSNPGGGG